jgi:hypothetical protein
MEDFMTSIRLHDIERHSWRMTHRDGLMDILFGFLLLGACVSSLVGMLDTSDWLRILSLSVVQFSGVGFLVWMRRREVTLRIGHVRFAAKRTRSLRSMRIILGACVAVTILLVIATSLSGRLGFSLFGDAGAWSVLGVVTAVVMIPIAVLSVVLDYPRLLLHGSLFVIAEFLLLVIGLEDIIAYAGTIVYGAGSLISFSIGIPIFVHFLRSVPRIAVDAGESSND